MASVAPSRFRTDLTLDPTTNALIERRVYWSETQWIPASTPGMYIHGDQTILAGTGKVTFIDCHVLPGSIYVYPFGEWDAATVGETTRGLTIEEHHPERTALRTVALDVDDRGRYRFPVTYGTRRVCTSVL